MIPLSNIDRFATCLTDRCLTNWNEDEGGDAHQEARTHADETGHEVKLITMDGDDVKKENYQRQKISLKEPLAFSALKRYAQKGADGAIERVEVKEFGEQIEATLLLGQEAIAALAELETEGYIAHWEARHINLIARCRPSPKGSQS